MALNPKDLAKALSQLTPKEIAKTWVKQSRTMSTLVSMR